MAILCVAALAVCACGNQGGKKAKGDDGKVDAEKVAEKLIQKAFEGEKYSKEAAEYYFLKNEGIKLADLAHNSDRTRFDHMTEADVRREEKYALAMRILKGGEE